MVSFKKFHESFQQKLQSPLFADSETSKPGETSAATKELRKKGGYDIFTKKFLRSLYQTLREYSRLKGEQSRVCKKAKNINPKLAEMWNELKAVETMKRRLENLDFKSEPGPLTQGRNRLKAAILDYESEIRREQDRLNSMVNPAARNSRLGRVRFEPVLRGDKYYLPTLKKKAPDHWVYDRLDQSLAAAMQPLGISDITRYRIMSALLESVGVNIKPITFKQHPPRQQALR